MGLRNQGEQIGLWVFLGRTGAWQKLVERVAVNFEMQAGVCCESPTTVSALLGSGTFEGLMLEWIGYDQTSPERVTALVRTAAVNLGVIAVANEEQIVERVSALDSGADDCVDYDIDLRELLARLRVASRHRVVERTASYSCHARLDQLAREYGLSGREQQTLMLIVQGVHLKEVGPALGCSYSTVRTHLRRLCAKLGCSGLREAIVKFFGVVGENASRLNVTPTGIAFLT